MEIYNSILIFLFLFFLVSSNQKSVFKTVFIAIILIVIASYKGIEVGSDTKEYYNHFHYLNSYSDTRTFSGIQIGWYYINEFFYRYFNYDIFMLFCYGLVIGGISYLIHKRSSVYSLSFLLFFLLCFYFQSLNIMRQYIAIGIICIGYTYLPRSKIKFVICLFIAFMFHFSVFFTLSILCFDRLSLKQKLWIYIIVASTFFVGFFLTEVTKNIVNVLLYFSDLNSGIVQYIQGYGGQRSIINNVIINGFFILSYSLSKTKNDLYLKLYFVYIILMNLFGSAEQGNRFFLYYQIGMIMAIPTIYREIKNKQMSVLYLIMILGYAIGIYYKTIEANAGEVIPYMLRGF